MLIFGLNLIKSDELHEVTYQEQIKQTAPNSVVVFRFRLGDKMVKYCQENGIEFAIYVKDTARACIANAMGAKYIITDELSEEIQKCAENYLFDSKVLYRLKKDDDVLDTIESAAKISYDGIITHGYIKTQDTQEPHIDQAQNPKPIINENDLDF